MASGEPNSGVDSRQGSQGRWRWVAAVTAVVVLVAVSIFASLMLRGEGGEDANLVARLRELERTYRQRGEPVELSHFESEPVPDGNNAAATLAEAALALELPEDWEAIRDAADNLRPGGDVSRFEEVVGENTGVLARVRRLRSISGVDWGLELRAGGEPNIKPLHLSAVRNTARLVYLAALVSSEQGKHDKAVRHVRDLSRIAEVLGRAPYSIAQLVSMSCEGYVPLAVEHISPLLEIGQGPGKVSRSEVRALIQSLPEDEQRRRRLIRSLRCERAMMLQGMIVKLSAESQVETWQDQLFDEFGRAYAGRSAIHAIEDMTKIIEAAREPTFPAFREKQPSALTDVEQFASPVQALLIPGFLRTVEIHYEGVARCRLAATRLAMRLYERERGKRPASLDDLVPRYLAAVPADPFRPGGAPLQMATVDGYELIYSVGLNGEDQGGRWSEDLGPDTHGGYDIPLFLDGLGPVEEKEPEPDEGSGSYGSGEGYGRRGYRGRRD